VIKLQALGEFADAVTHLLDHDPPLDRLRRSFFEHYIASSVDASLHQARLYSLYPMLRLSCRDRTAGQFDHPAL
jgi:hypothetical protein